MRDLLPRERARLYDNEMGERFPGSTPHVGEDGRLQAIWLLGQDYKGSGYHGAFPPNYMARIEAMFSDAERRVHLFSGSLPESTSYVRVDSIQLAEIHADAEHISKASWCWKHRSQLCGGGCIGVLKADFIHADPPYTGEDANTYGTPMVNRNKVVQECAQVVEPGGFLVWMDMVLPMYRKQEWEIYGLIGLVRSTNHRFRGVTIFRRLP